ncbi:amidohydrolase [Aspergillus ellipticus CBS 707.79]|uniref:Amidohydrolase n=1 Tax=Aspergillus ellipticus CBS 707.79 TaxID=1448320 RepID=A0A319ETD8_9EURO|nr:amidohydrolase [Aspergillus ellipticus CBS 707.79]
MSDIKSLIENNRPDLSSYEDTYGRIHENPDLSHEEKSTSKITAHHLKKIGFHKVHTKIGGGYGVAGVLHNGDEKTVLLRGDMDALPLNEDTGLEYSSTKPNVMHACGHDFHVVGLMGAAELLVKAMHSWSGTLICVFQPAEDTGDGAKGMVYGKQQTDLSKCRKLLYDLVPKPDIVLVQHSWDITINGRGGHGSMPQACIDTIVIGSAVVARLQTIVSREINPGSTAVVTVGSIQAGTSANVIPDTLTLKVNSRRFPDQIPDGKVDGETTHRIEECVKRITIAECDAAGCTEPPIITRVVDTPATYNDADTVDSLMSNFAPYFGDKMVEGTYTTASEDFTELAINGTPYTMWFFGGIDQETWDSTQDKNTLPVNHWRNFAPAIQPTLQTAADAMAIGALTFLGKEANSTLVTMSITTIIISAAGIIPMSTPIV